MSECGCGCSKEKVKTAKKGDKITAKKCPRCNDKIVVIMKDGAEVFECQNCKFRITKK